MLPVHRSELYHQRGSGVGAIFSTLFRTLVPLVGKVFNLGSTVAKTQTGQRVLQAAKKSALNAGLELAKDTLQGENVLKSIKRRSKEAGKNLLEDLDRGSGKMARGRKPKKRKHPMKRSGRAKKKRLYGAAAAAAKKKKKRTKGRPKRSKKKSGKRGIGKSNVSTLLKRLGV